MVDLPTILHGHWETPESAVIVARCVDQTRVDLCMGDCADLSLANAIFLIDRYSLDLLPLQTAAKERIRWLSVQLAIANAKVAGLTHVDDAVGGLRKYCNAMIKQMTRLGADNFPCFHPLNAFLRECDKVFLAQNFENSSAAVVHDPRVTDNDRDEITVSLGGKEIRGWSYANDTERRAKMLCAHEYVEGWHDAIAKKGETP